MFDEKSSLTSLGRLSAPAGLQHGDARHPVWWRLVAGDVFATMLSASLRGSHVSEPCSVLRIILNTSV